MGVLAPREHRPWPSEREDMPLLRSLAACAACVAINMALLRSFSPRCHHPAALWKVRLEDILVRYRGARSADAGVAPYPLRRWHRVKLR